MQVRNLILWTVLLGAAGCGPRPETVWIDLSRVPVPDESAYRPLPSGTPTPVPSDELAIEAQPARRVFSGGGEATAEYALEAVKRNQQRALEQLMVRLRRSALAEVSALEREREAELDQSYAANLDSAFDGIQAEFERYASKAGPRWRELAWRAGFPDPDPASKRPPRRPTRNAQENFDRARELRGELRALSADYRSSVTQSLDELEATLRKQRTGLAAEMAQLRAEREAEAIRQARQIVDASVADLEQSLINPNATLWPTIGSVAKLEGVPAPPKPVLPRSSPDPHRPKWLKDQASLFARMEGYRLADEPGRARNATEEFLEWRKRLDLGP